MISLDNIAIGADPKPPKVVIYGVGGIGKSTWASGAPNPFFLFTEEGLGKLKVPHFKPRERDPVLRSWEELCQGCQVLYEGEHDYQTVVLDTLDFAEPLAWAYTSAQHGKADIEEFGFGKGYVYATDVFRGLLDWFDRLRNDRNMAVVIIAHSMHKKFDAPDMDSYDRYQIRVHERVANLVHDWADAVVFANYRASLVKAEKKVGKASETARKRAVGTGERILYTEARPAFVAKNRYGLPPELPLDWAQFQEGILDTTPTEKAS